eukprot:TRINITY_DN478_c2_g1_i3.p1 TRINITY_DN478_c2_g1~~TRINITY_DN478_c2_g1_i3.p1  ORF type:complete len:351 (+),score=90.46 TRINITY_DN478_c2_g1_i3:66-1055(+)
MAALPASAAAAVAVGSGAASAAAAAATSSSSWRRGSRQYDWKLPTEKNWAVSAPGRGGLHSAYSAARAKLDYSYHSHYAPERVAVQDGIVTDMLRRGSPDDRPWVVFTAGAMGAGKGYAVDNLLRGMLRLHHPVMADPDRVRPLLPESAGYSPADMGAKTQKESGLVSELVMHGALEQKIPLVIDGTLRDAGYARSTVDYIRKEHPQYRIAVAHITAPAGTARRRARLRAGRPGGRVVPESQLSYESEIPAGVSALQALVDATLTIDNGGAVPQLVGSVPEAVARSRGPPPAQPYTTTASAAPPAPSTSAVRPGSLSMLQREERDDERR